MTRPRHLYRGGCPEYAGDPGRNPACALCRQMDGLPELPRHRVERLVQEEIRSMVFDIVRKIEPRAPRAAVEQAVDEVMCEQPPPMHLTDEEVAGAPASDDDVRRAWREHFKPKLIALFAGAMPS